MFFGKSFHRKLMALFIKMSLLSCYILKDLRDGKDNHDGFISCVRGFFTVLKGILSGILNKNTCCSIEVIEFTLEG